ncbi:MAG: hypothetical protein H7X86_13590 [Gorillibacterium sp.]|nr:hypothetical protein [Gorillibacterium sp.]
MTNLNDDSRDIPAPVGEKSWSGSIGTISGKKTEVISDKNTNRTYYAWDRYSGIRGKVWYAGTGSTGCIQGPISAPANGGLCTPGSTPTYTTSVKLA